MITADWELLSPRDQPASVTAIATGAGGIWAGGLGGVSKYSERDGWTSPPISIATHSVSALAFGDGSLLAGHETGIARSTDGGKTWTETSVSDINPTISALALSPAFATDGVALAGTVRSGVLRSSDHGRSWKISNFGL